MDATNELSPEKESSQERISPARNNNERNKFNDIIEDFKYYSNQIK